MRPETVHLIATGTRHLRGLLNAVEKFERTIPREHRAREVATLIEFTRAALVAADASLMAVSTPVETVSSAR